MANPPEELTREEFILGVDHVIQSRETKKVLGVAAIQSKAAAYRKPLSSFRSQFAAGSHRREFQWQNNSACSDAQPAGNSSGDYQSPRRTA